MTTNRLTDFQNSFQADIKKQLNEMRADINREIEEATGKIVLTNERFEEAEQRIGDMETWSAGAKDAVNSLLKTQHALKAKVTEREGHSRRNNIRLYGVRETAEGTSVANFVEKLIKTELGEDIPPNTNLSIERVPWV